MATLQWKDTFSAFNGPAKLDASFMVKTKVQGPNTNAQKDDTAADCAKFYAWIETLRAHVGVNTGIPTDYVQDVKELLEKFFPEPGADNNWKPAIRIKYKDIIGNDPDICFVKFGKNSPRRKLGILDAATALGYIFTVAEPPQNATWENYYLPLQLLYCRFLYLAFAYGRSFNDVLIPTALDVPQTSCVMYAGVGEPIRYYYGSSPARVYTPVADMMVIRANSLQMLDLHRLENVLKQNLEEYTGNTKHIPRYSPKNLEDLAGSLWTALIKDSLNPDAQLLKEKFVALPIKKIRGHAKIGARLEQNLQVLVAARFLPPGGTYEKDKPETIVAWKGMLAEYLAPHIFPKTLPQSFEIETTNSAKEIQDAVTEVLEPLWVALKDELLSVLDYVYLEQKDRHARNPFGRCAETYCVVSMLNIYNNPAPMDSVRGMALTVSSVGNTDAFQAAFDSVALGKATSKNVFKLPCKNCQQLLPLYDIKLGNSDYDKDMTNVPDQPAAAPLI